MPITQDRMLNLLREYHAFVRHAEVLRAEITSAIRDATSQAEQQALLETALRLNPAPPTYQLREEIKHFLRQSKRNDAARARMERKRKAIDNMLNAAALPASRVVDGVATIRRRDGTTVELDLRDTLQPEDDLFTPAPLPANTEPITEAEIEAVRRAFETTGGK
jgi:hypothetical protein